MKANNLQKAAKILAEIHELDKQIIALDKKAIEVSNGHDFISIELGFTKPKKEKKNTEDDNMQSLYGGILMGLGSMRFGEPSESDTEKLKFTLSDTELLFVLGALISVKREERKRLCSKILGLGVNI